MSNLFDRKLFFLSNQRYINLKVSVMDLKHAFESKLELTVAGCGRVNSPQRLFSAIKHAVFPGGARIRPRLCLAIASSFEKTDLELALSASVSIELLHCASLVHDDLPCFDNADLRRGQLSVHRAFDERLAILAGDSLIVEAFRSLNSCDTTNFDRLRKITGFISDGVGSVSGIIAGQAWECEKKASLIQYQKEKTGSLFEAATVCGAASAGYEVDAWRSLGEKIGEAYQVADDIRDVIAHPEELGKPTGKDVELGRMSSARELGLSGAVSYFDNLIDSAVNEIPDCKNIDNLQSLIRSEADRLVPKKGRIKIKKIASKAFS